MGCSSRVFCDHNILNDSWLIKARKVAKEAFLALSVENGKMVVGEKYE